MHVRHSLCVIKQVVGHISGCVVLTYLMSDLCILGINPVLLHYAVYTVTHILQGAWLSIMQPCMAMCTIHLMHAIPFLRCSSLVLIDISCLCVDRFVACATVAMRQRLDRLTVVCAFGSRLLWVAVSVCAPSD